MTQRTKQLKDLTAVLLLCAVTISACGVPSESEVVAISETELPDELRIKIETTTTTTTVADAPPSKETATSLAEVVSEPVDLYYISANRLVATTLSIVSPATTSQVLEALISGPPTGDNYSGLRSALPKDLESSITISKGIAQIDTTSEFLTNLSPIDQRLAIAQLVLTFTRRPGVGQVLFSVEGQFIAVPRGRGDLAKPGTSVSFDEYSSLLVAASG